MARLQPPTADVRASFLAAMAELRVDGRGGSGDPPTRSWEVREYGRLWATPEGFERYVRMVRAEALEESPRPEGFVPSTTLWWIEGEDYLGRITIRHRLTPVLLEVGGHIGYDVRPSARRRGHATAMLRAALPIAYGLGIEKVLVTCDEHNTGSRKAIERNGGVLEDQRGIKLRFWISTGS